ncbi:MAG: peptide ABC transporter substrate-binding protein [Hyphomicrobiaceae bacterium]|nr:peptide ABC transporter substrate-binding protein [Hyphomicrobiaceae bacterium]
MKHTLIRTSAFALGVASIALFGLSAQAAMVPAGATLADNQTFTMRVLSEFDAIDPQLSETVDAAGVERDLFEGLFNQDADGNLVPGVALSYDVSDDKTVYTFHLRPEAMWSDGHPVTAADFEYAWKRLADPATGSPYQWYVTIMGLKNGDAVTAGDMPLDDLGVKAIDDHTLQVTLEQPTPYFTKTTVNASTFPVPKWVIDEFGDDWTLPEHIVGNGAYVLTEHVPNERLVRERNPKYWDDANTVITKTTSLIINDENVALARWKAGEVDRTEVPTGQFPTLKAEYPDSAMSAPRLCTYYYWYNEGPTGPEALKDVRVRQALSYALDRNVITDQILQGGQFPAYTFTPAATAGFTPPSVPFGEMTQDERDAKAKELMAAAGFGPDHPLTFNLNYNTSEAHKQIATVVAQMWKTKLGVDATLVNMEGQTYFSELRNGNFDVGRSGWCGDYNEASTFLDLVRTDSGQNDGKYSNAEVDALMAEAKTMTDPNPNYEKVEQIIAEDMPIIPVYHYATSFMIDPGLAQSWPLGNVEQNWYSKDLYRLAK